MFDPGEDLHQRGFARTVFAEQGMDLTALDRQVDRLERMHAGIAFTDVFQLQKAAHTHLIAARLSVPAEPQPVALARQTSGERQR
nr:hypothetical protein [Tanacetum cinerariifolium]